MSLRAFHIIFIAASSSVMAFLLFWASRGVGGAHPGLKLCAQLGLVAALVYLVWFIRKYRTLA